MNYKALKKFVSEKMSMQHIYQPVMLMTLLENEGRAHQYEIAGSILGYDQSQLDYYKDITNNMVGKVLRKHNVVQKDGKEYCLVGFESLNNEEVESLKELCEEKLTNFLEDRGEQAWNHRKKSSGYISGTIRYEVFKRAKFHCELCGISAEEKALEVDHIVPRNNGGSDELSNFQSLCYSCNAMKRDRDSTDFRIVRESYEHKEEGCLFCEIEPERVIASNNLAYVIRDGFPVTDLHSLVIPKRHVKTYFDLGQAEINAINQLLTEQKEIIEKEDPSVTGFNIGMNCGEDAGQTVFHCHVHLIPRRKGDVDVPKGGVRNTIPGKGSY